MQFSIKDLIVDGVLGGAHSGMERVEVLACLGEPDDWMDPDKGPPGPDQAPIWRYGNFEIHFLPDDSVYILFLDYLAEPEAGESRQLDAWILQDMCSRTLEAIRAELKQRGVVVQETQDERGTPVLSTEGGASLLFDNPDGQWIWHAIVVVGDESAKEFEKVYTLPDWYDGPRRGIANFEGKPHLFESQFEDLDNDEDIFVLFPVAATTFQLALEDWQIWRRWQRAYQANETPEETHPALPEERERRQQLQGLLIEAGVQPGPRQEGDEPPRPTIDSADAIRATAEFEPSGTDNGHASLRVRWTRI